MTTSTNFWCSCGLGYKTEARRDRHCLLRQHQPADAQPERVSRRGRRRRDVADRLLRNSPS